MRRYGLIGFPLGHSFSEKYFTEKFHRESIDDCSYRAFEIESVDMLPALIKSDPCLRGFNVTIPYKQQVLQYIDVLSPEADLIRAVNCIDIGKDGKLTGYNTDAYGFETSLLSLIGQERPRALILGTGGASKAIIYVLRKLGIDYTQASRTKSDNTITYDQIDKTIIDSRHLIINTTPLGTYPDTDHSAALPYDMLGREHYLFDVVYNPALTKFLMLGAERGAAICNGYEMLVGQAEKSWEIWNNR